MPHGERFALRNKRASAMIESCSMEGSAFILEGHHPHAEPTQALRRIFSKFVMPLCPPGVCCPLLLRGLSLRVVD